jgi:hypothetical protein
MHFMKRFDIALAVGVVLIVAVWWWRERKSRAGQS